MRPEANRECPPSPCSEHPYGSCSVGLRMAVGLHDRCFRHGGHHHWPAMDGAAFNIGAYTLLPFGQKAVSRAEYYGDHDIGTGPLGVLGNVLWLVLAGWWLALAHRSQRSCWP